MIKCLFSSDFHGKIERYNKFFSLIETEKPDLVFWGGDLLPNHYKHNPQIPDFINDFLAPKLLKLKQKLAEQYPQIFVILGNDDPKTVEPDVLKLEESGLCSYVHCKKISFKEYTIYGCSYVPPTPFQLKDWELYDVSRFVDPGCVPPTEGFRTVPADKRIIEHLTIKNELEKLTDNNDLSKSVFLFHCPPYSTKLDRAALDGMKFEHVPIDVHIGSIAIKQFIENRKPYLTMHGHVHESTSITKLWQEKIGDTYAFQAAHNGPELSVILFDLENLTSAERILI